MLLEAAGKRRIRGDQKDKGKPKALVILLAVGGSHAIVPIHEKGKEGTLFLLDFCNGTRLVRALVVGEDKCAQ